MGSKGDGGTITVLAGLDGWGGVRCRAWHCGGELLGYSGPETGKPKADHYALIQELAEEFRKKNGSIICRDLLSGITSDTAPVPEARTDDYYKKRPCKDLAVCAAEILERKLEERKAQDLEKNGQK
ncbi:MAG: C-GCAxxG-C-C family protein [Enterocloster sp.]